MGSSELRALVLAGGQSQRMGSDKGELIYHDKPQKLHVAKQLQKLGLETFISIRDKQDREKGYNYLIDAHTAMGPLSGLLTAYETYSNAWLCVGCDYPLLQVFHLQKLLKAREKSLFATVFQDKKTGFLIPTLAIYEVSFFELLKRNVAEEQFSLQRILKSNPCKIIPVEGDAFSSVDTKKDYDRIKRELGLPTGNR